MKCAWCGRELGKKHGYSETGQPICSSYSTPPNKVYCACKARKNRLEEKRKKAQKASEGGEIPKHTEKREIEPSSTIVEAFRILISQLDELILLQRQQMNAPKQVVTETRVISTTTFEAPTFEDDLMADIEIKQDTSTKSAETFRREMLAMANKEGIWADKPKDIRQ